MKKPHPTPNTQHPTPNAQGFDVLLDGTPISRQSLWLVDELSRETYAIEIGLILRQLGIPSTYGTDRRLSPQPEASDVVEVGLDIYERPLKLTPDCARAWKSMHQHALKDGVVLQLVSGFRSVQYQRGIIERKLAKGMHIQEILRSSAAPGFSEHHTGRAIDITTPGATVLHEDFDRTVAFDWLTRNASQFGFHLSFPRNNPHGIVYEPWHWLHKTEV